MVVVVFLKFNFVVVQINNCFFLFLLLLLLVFFFTPLNEQARAHTHTHTQPITHGIVYAAHIYATLMRNFYACHFAIDFLSNPEFKIKAPFFNQ